MPCILEDIMKKIISALLLLVVVFSLASCFEQSYSAASLKSGLEKGGYTVVENPTIVNLETSKMEGLKTVLYGYKTVDGKEAGVLLLVFDNIDHASEVSNGTYGSDGTVRATETMSLLNDWGRKHSLTDDPCFGTANNVVWAGDKAARIASGIKILTD